MITSDAQLGVRWLATLSAKRRERRVDPERPSPNTIFNRTFNVVGSGGIDVALHPITWSGVISGSGQFIKSGTGVLQLTGANTYTGGTLVRNGVLWVTSDAQLGAPSAGVTLDGGTFRVSQSFGSARPFNLVGSGRIEIDPSWAVALNGVISGGTLTKQDLGTLFLNGANTYATTVITGGAVLGNSTSIRGNVDFQPAPNGGPLQVTFEQTADGTFGGAIRGAGSLNKTGAASLTLTGENTYSGGTTVQAGTLIGTSDSLQGAIVNNGAVVFDQSSDGRLCRQPDGLRHADQERRRPPLDHRERSGRRRHEHQRRNARGERHADQRRHREQGRTLGRQQECRRRGDKRTADTSRPAIRSAR